MQIMQIFFLQDLKDLALNLTNLALNMKLLLQDIAKILARKLSYNFFLRDFYVLQEKLHFSVRLTRYVQDLLQDLSSLTRKTLARITYFLQHGFYIQLINRKTWVFGSTQI